MAVAPLSKSGATMPHNNFNMSSQFIDTLCIDWLQLHVKCPFFSDGQMMGCYTIKQAQGGTLNFKKLYYITAKNEDVAVLVTEPHLEAMGKDFGLLKISNKFLYQIGLKDFVIDLLVSLRLKFVNITRLDVAGDFLKFDKNLKPENFIAGIHRGKYVKVGKTKMKQIDKDNFKTDKGTKCKISDLVLSTLGDVDVLKKMTISEVEKIKQSLNNKFKNNFYHRSPDTIKTMFSNKIKLMPEMIKYGSEKSRLSYVLYNKTKELEDVKNKPWIKDHWRSYGWDCFSDIWRLEFSFKATTQGYTEVDMETGDIFKAFDFKTLDMLDSENVTDLYKYHFCKYFRFVAGNDKGRKDRRMPVQLKDHWRSNLVKIELSEKKQSDRSDKIFLAKLLKTNQEVRGDDFELGIFTDHLLANMVEKTGLHQWFGKKFPSIDLPSPSFGLVKQIGVVDDEVIRGKRYANVARVKEWAKIYEKKKEDRVKNADLFTKLIEEKAHPILKDYYLWLKQGGKEYF